MVIENYYIYIVLSMVIDHRLRAIRQKKMLTTPERFLYASIEIKDVRCTHCTNMK